MISKHGIVGFAFTTLKFCTSEVQILEAIFTSGSDFFFHCGSSNSGNVFIILLEIQLPEMNITSGLKVQNLTAVTRGS